MGKNYQPQLVIAGFLNHQQYGQIFNLRIPFWQVFFLRIVLDDIIYIYTYPWDSETNHNKSTHFLMEIWFFKKRPPCERHWIFGNWSLEPWCIRVHLCLDQLRSSEKWEGKGRHFSDIFTPLKTNISPEKWWLEDVFPIEIVPFLGTC